MLHAQLCGNKVTLRLLQEQYFHDYLAMFSPTVKAALHVRDSRSELTYLQERLQCVQQGRTFFYCIFDNADQRLVGGIEIRDAHEHKGQLYSWLNEAYWGGGRYQEALALITDAYFAHHETLYFNAHIDVTNQRSYHALRKFGCAQAGFCDGPYGKQYNVIVRRKVARS